MRSIEGFGCDEEPWTISGPTCLCEAIPFFVIARHDSAEAISVMGSGIDMTNLLTDRREHQRYTVTNVS